MVRFVFGTTLLLCLAKAFYVSSHPFQEVFLPQNTSANGQTWVDLFGGDAGRWVRDDWVAVDDSVRGGISKSHLTPSIFAHTATFHGTLNTEKLNGAGFASQRTKDRYAQYDLSVMRGITLTYTQGDGRTYTLNLIDTIAAKLPDGRLESVIVYKFLFNATATLHRTIHIPWTAFVPYYRGRAVEDAPSLDTTSIRTFSIMIHSLFGKQKAGKFRVEIVKIGAYGEEAVDEEEEVA